MEVDRQTVKDGFVDVIRGQGILSEVAALYQPYIEKLYSSDQEKVLEGVHEIKNLVIGNNKRKTNFIVLGAAVRLVYLIQDVNVTLQVKSQAATVLGSLAKGFDTNVQSLIDQNVVETICNGLSSRDLPFYEACIRCLRTMIVSCNAAGKALYFDSATVIPQMLKNINRSLCTQECTCEILGQCCRLREHQDLLLNLEVLEILANLLETSAGRVKVKVMIALAAVCFKNATACNKCLTTATQKSGKLLVKILIELLAQSQLHEIQLFAARCLAYMFRVGVLTVNSYDGVIVRKVVPCLVRMCDATCTFQERIEGAETLAYLTEVDPPLQRLAYICEQFPQKLETYFQHPVIADTKSLTEVTRFKRALKYEQGLLRVGFLAYASLLSNDEDIRKQVATEVLVNNVAESIVSPSADVRKAALRCLLSLSRSIHLLRTTFQDVGVWKALLKLVGEARDDIEETKVLSSILCNMTLDFCPSKEELQSAGLLQELVKWVNIEDLKLNAIWCLMNMSFQANRDLKLQILDTIGFDQIAQLTTDADCNVILRTLGLLRNVLHECDDKIQSHHGIAIIQTCKHILTAFATAGIGNPALCAQYESIRAHTLCVLGCLASCEEGSAVQNYLQSETEILQLAISFLSHFDSDLQLATVTYLCHFIQAPGSCAERQNLLLEYGVVSGLRQLQSTNDTILYDKVEETLQCLHDTKT